MADWRETEGLKPIDKADLGLVSESPGRNGSEREVASRMVSSGGRARTERAKAAWAVAGWLMRRFYSGGVISGGTVARGCRATGEALLVPGRNPWSKVGRITTKGKSVEGERVAEGLIGAMRSGNADRAKGPYCFVTPLSIGEARAR
jgi:hypothetical protein